MHVIRLADPIELTPHGEAATSIGARVEDPLEISPVDPRALHSSSLLDYLVGLRHHQLCLSSFLVVSDPTLELGTGFQTSRSTTHGSGFSVYLAPAWNARFLLENETSSHHMIGRGEREIDPSLHVLFFPVDAV
jgi:hypothetical protein